MPGPFHRDWRLVREQGYSSEIVESALASYTTPLSDFLDQFTFEDPDAEWEGVLRSIRDITGRNDPDYTPVSVGGVEQPKIPAPFLVLKVDWLNDGTEIGYYSEADQATSTYQLHGRVTAVGDFSRGFGPDHSLQRAQVSIRLEDIDRVFATRVRSNDHLLSRWSMYVGSPSLKPQSFEALATKMRVLSVASITETEVEFTLIEAAEDLCGQTIRPPLVNEVGRFDGVRLSDPEDPSLRITWSNWGDKLRTINGLENSTGKNVAHMGSTGNPVTIPFGRAVYRAPFAWCRVPPSGEVIHDFNRTNPLAVIVLGASKNKDWMKSHWFGWCVGRGGSDNRALGQEPIIWAGKPHPANPETNSIFLATQASAAGFTLIPNRDTGIVAYIDVTEAVSSQERSDATPWYIATLFVLGFQNATGNLSFGAKEGVSGGASARFALGRLQNAIKANEVWIDINGYGAAGPGAFANWWTKESPAPYGDTPEDVIRYLIRHHSGLGVGGLTGPTRVVEGLEDVHTADSMKEPVGGVIVGETDGSQVLDDLCSTFGLDPGIIGRGRIMLRPQTTTLDDKVAKIPRQAPTFTDDVHILDGSWEEFAPRGSDRWGFGTLFRFNGIGELAAGDFERFGKGTSPASPLVNYGQEIEKAINIAWRRQLGNEDTWSKRHNYTRPYQTPRYGAKFSVGIPYVLGINNGDYCYVTHYAGSNADGTKGWDRRICRIDNIDYQWESRTARLTVIDWDADFVAKDWVLDSDLYWERAKPFLIGDTVALSNGSQTVQFAGAITPHASWVDCELRISRAYNPRPYPASNHATYRPTEAQCGAWKITAIDAGAKQVTIDVAATAAQAGTRQAWRVLYTHINPPTDPYHYPDGNADLYGRLCSEEALASDGSLGAFSNGDPAYRLGK